MVKEAGREIEEQRNRRVRELMDALEALLRIP